MDSARTALRSIGDTRDAPGIGRQARLELVFSRRAGRTVLSRGYAEPPLRVGRWFPESDGAHMILASSAPGIFGGDRFEQTIVVEPGARVRLTSQSALQIHPSMDGEAARLSACYHVEEDAELWCEWHPAIPFAAARLDQSISLHLAATARVIWSDAFMAGRACSRLSDVGGVRVQPDGGERWAFAELSHELSARRADTLEYLERYRVVPHQHSPDKDWIAGGATHFGTVVSSGWPVDSAALAVLHHELAEMVGVRAAVDCLGEKLALVRLMADSGAPFHRARCHAAAALGASLNQKR